MKSIDRLSARADEARRDVSTLPTHLRGAMQGDTGFVESGVAPPEKPRDVRSKTGKSASGSSSRSGARRGEKRTRR
jgi:hypothetical protein